MILFLKLLKYFFFRKTKILCIQTELSAWVLSPSSATDQAIMGFFYRPQRGPKFQAASLRLLALSRTPHVTPKSESPRPQPSLRWRLAVHARRRRGQWPRRSLRQGRGRRSVRSTRRGARDRGNGEPAGQTEGLGRRAGGGGVFRAAGARPAGENPTSAVSQVRAHVLIWIGGN